MSTKHDQQKKEAKDNESRRRYEAPSVLDEQAFETTVLMCTGNTGDCITISS